MDGVGFIASLHATTLDSHGSELELLKPVRRQSRRSSRESISDKAKNLVNKSKSFFSISSSSSTGTRTSQLAPSPRSSDHGHAGCDKELHSLLDGHSIFASPPSSRLPSEDRSWKFGQSTPSPSSPMRKKLGSASRDCKHLAMDETIARIHSRCSTVLACHAQPDATWISILVDSGYISPPSSPQPRSPSYEIEIDSDVEPSRASSMLDRELISFSDDDSPHMLRSELPQPSSPEEEKHRALLDDDRRSLWLTDSQNVFCSDLKPSFIHRIEPPGFSRHAALSEAIAVRSTADTRPVSQDSFIAA